MKTQTTKSNKTVYRWLGKKPTFGHERVGIFRPICLFFKHIFKPETAVDHCDLWTMFRVKEREAIRIAKQIADIIEIDYTRLEGEAFLTAFSTLCRSCTPDCINKIFHLMFRRPVFFNRSIGSDTVRWMASLPTTTDQDITVSVSPIKVEYLNEFCVRASILTECGPYISAKFTTIEDDAEATATTSGRFEFYVSADHVFNREWDLPGVMRYTVTASLEYNPNTRIGSSGSFVQEIIRRCVEDVLLDKTLWSGDFGESRPKKGSPYYRATIGYSGLMFVNRVEKMVPVRASSARQFIEEYAISKRSEEGTEESFEDVSNFDISGDRAEISTDKSAFTITVYPPLDGHPKRKPASKAVTVDVQCTMPEDGKSIGGNDSEKEGK